MPVISRSAIRGGIDRRQPLICPAMTKERVPNTAAAMAVCPLGELRPGTEDPAPQPMTAILRKPIAAAATTKAAIKTSAARRFPDQAS